MTNRVPVQPRLLVLQDAWCRKTWRGTIPVPKNVYGITSLDINGYWCDDGYPFMPGRHA